MMPWKMSSRRWRFPCPPRWGRGQTDLIKHRVIHADQRNFQLVGTVLLKGGAEQKAPPRAAQLPVEVLLVGELLPAGKAHLHPSSCSRKRRRPSARGPGRGSQPACRRGPVTAVGFPAPLQSDGQLRPGPDDNPDRSGAPADSRDRPARRHSNQVPPRYAEVLFMAWCQLTPLSTGTRFTSA